MNTQLSLIVSSLLALIKSQWLIILFSLFTLIFIYWLLPASKRKWLWDYLVPILFFLALTSRTLLQAIRIILNWTGKTRILILISLNNLLILSFMTLTIISYIIRSKPMHKAVGIMERAFPIFVVLSHLVGASLIALYLNIKFRFNPILYLLGISISISGATLDCFALWKLKRSFSIMVEVRPLITSGIYGKIRHPLYTGELLHFLGISLIFNNTAVYGMFVILVILQSLRAKLEEKKLIAHLPDYLNYKKTTGFFFPRFRHKNT